MTVYIDKLNRVYVADNQNPKQSIVFDLHKDYVAVYQDSENPEERKLLEQFDVAAQFDVESLISDLKEVVEILESREWTREERGI